MKIKITSDSTCDLPQELLLKNDVALIPLCVVMDGKDYSDGVNITPADIYQHVAQGGELCTTAALNPEVYHSYFEKYASQYDAVIHISIGSLFSSTYQNACIAASDFQNVRVIDSCSLSTGQGLVVLNARKFAESSSDLDEIVRKTQEFTKKVEISFVLDRLDYMVKGGRCSTATALGANLLNLKPCIEVKDGKMVVVKKYRGNYAKCLHNYITDRLANRTDIDTDTLFVTKAPVSPEAIDTVKAALAQYQDFENQYWTDVGCTVSCHCGPGTLGIIFARK